MQPLLSIQNLTIEPPRPLDRRYAVEDVSIDLMPGELRCLVGESGSGKSLTARAVMRLLAHHGIHRVTGRILLHDRDLLALSDREMAALRGRKIGMVFQEPLTALNPLKRVREQIGEIFSIHGIRLTAKEREGRIARLLEDMNLPDPDRIARSYPFELSGGQRQRVVIAIACALKPELIIADEPTTALDVTTQRQILALFDEIRRRNNAAILFITHDFGVVAEVADSITVMKDGRIVEQGAAQGVIDCPQHPYTRSLLAAVPRIRTDSTATRGASDVVLSVRDLSKRFWFRRAGSFRKVPIQALNAVSFDLRRGEVLGIVGESGSGKSTLSRCLTGLSSIEAGSVRLDGREVSVRDRRTARYVRERVQMVFQDPFSSLNPRKRVIDIITAGFQLEGADRTAIRDRALKLLELVGLSADAAGRFPHQFSGGQRQRIGIARALIRDPRVLIADEAVSALDVTTQAQILDLLRQVRERLGLSIMFVTHDLRVAGEICDRILVMKDGAVVDAGTVQHVLHTSDVAYTRQLVAAIPGRKML